MFERYTESARRALFFSRYEASQFGSWYIGTEHLLLGLLRESKGALAKILTDANVSSEQVRREIAESLSSSRKISTAVEIPFDDHAKRALSFAAEEADRLRHSYIGGEHLLLGLLRVEDSAAAALLANRGLRLDAVREQVAKLCTGDGLVFEDSRAHVDAAAEVMQTLSNTAKLSPDAANVVAEITALLERLRRLL